MQCPVTFPRRSEAGPGNRPAGSRRARTPPGRTAAPPRRGCVCTGRSFGRPISGRRSPRARCRPLRGRGRRSARRRTGPRLVQERTGDRELLLHALAERAGLLVAAVPQVEQTEKPFDALPANRRGPSGGGRRTPGSGGPSSVRRGPASRSGGRSAGGRPRVGDDIEALEGGRPSLGEMSAVRSRTVVVLPAPLGPRRPKTSPGWRSNERCRIVPRSPKRRPRPSVRMSRLSGSAARQAGRAPGGPGRSRQPPGPTPPARAGERHSVAPRIRQPRSRAARSSAASG